MTSQELKEKLQRDEELRVQLLRNLKAELPNLKALLAAAEAHWGIEDAVYRFYHGSFKVYGLAQSYTERIVAALRALLPDRELDSDFLDIVKDGTGKQFEMSHNQDWLRHTRPMVEALFHAHYFLKMACKYGEQLSESPQVLPSGWAAFLYLYRLR